MGRIVHYKLGVALGPVVQERLRASGTGMAHFGRYAEMCPSQLRRMLDR
jgi:hypothetical protein